MNKIIRERYPVSKLPEDLREIFPPGAVVRITLETQESVSSKPFAQIREQIEVSQRAGRWPSTTVEEATARIRALRDEWDA